MALAKFGMELAWKDHNVNLEAFKEWAVAQDEGNCCGTSADANKLTVHFLEEPSQEVQEAINDKWADLDDEEHEWCASYKSKEELAAEKAAAKAAAISAFATASGLSQEQIELLLS